MIINKEMIQVLHRIRNNNLSINDFQKSVRDNLKLYITQGIVTVSQHKRKFLEVSDRNYNKIVEEFNLKQQRIEIPKIVGKYVLRPKLTVSYYIRVTTYVNCNVNTILKYSYQNELYRGYYQFNLENIESEILETLIKKHNIPEEYIIKLKKSEKTI